MEEGSLRVDANVSARQRGETKLGTKTEVKNLNSFSGVERALEVEFARQCAVLDARRHDRAADDAVGRERGEVRPARSKEGSHDYRYFPEPDLPPLVLARDVDRRSRARRCPSCRRRGATRFAVGVQAHATTTIEVLTANRALADVLRAGRAHASGDPKTRGELGMGEVLARSSAAPSIDALHDRARPTSRSCSAWCATAR